MTLTAVIVTYNEETNIKECIESVKFADKILVCDSKSPDKTVEIARELGADVIISDIKYPEHNKNLAIEKSETDWILIVDADERPEPEMAEEIKQVTQNNDCQGYWVYRRNYFLGKEIKHAGWESDKVLRLFKKGTAKYPDQRVHGVLEFSGNAGVLKSRLIHYSYKDFKDYFAKLDRYTTWSALDNKNKKVNPLKLFINPLFRFIKMYIFKLGFLDGIHGFILCVTAAFSVFIKYSKIFLQKR